jgi:hypothetical protein
MRRSNVHAPLEHAQGLHGPEDRVTHEFILLRLLLLLFLL